MSVRRGVLIDNTKHTKKCVHYNVPHRLYHLSQVDPLLPCCSSSGGRRRRWSALQSTSMLTSWHLTCPTYLPLRTCQTWTCRHLSRLPSFSSVQNQLLASLSEKKNRSSVLVQKYVTCEAGHTLYDIKPTSRPAMIRGHRPINCMDANCKMQICPNTPQVWRTVRLFHCSCSSLSHPKKIVSNNWYLWFHIGPPQREVMH